MRRAPSPNLMPHSLIHRAPTLSSNRFISTHRSFRERIHHGTPPTLARINNRSSLLFLFCFSFFLHHKPFIFSFLHYLTRG
ncbi:hypothetical protein BDV12DRAFT_687 [Aspergillus spectabilis]